MKKRYYIAIAILLVICSLLFLLTHFSNATILSTEGYFVTGDKIEEVLLSDKKVLKSKNVKLEKVTYEDKFYNNLGNLYVGEEEKTEVNSNYPIYSNEGVAIVNINEKSKLINDRFEYFESYENFTLTGGKLYNYGDLEQADYENYILLQLPNGIYVNLDKLVIKTNTREIEVAVNSIIYFDGNFLRYFAYSNDGKLVYHIEEGIDLYNEVTIGDATFIYKDLLQTIGKIDKDEEKEEEITPGDDKEDDKDNNGSNIGSGDNKPVKYVKPKVSADKFDANVYSASSKLNISDPAGVIIGGVNFEFKIGEKIFLRKTYVSSGDFKIIGLVPNTEFTIIGSYKYFNEKNKKMEYTFFEQKIKTGDTKNLPEIKLGFENGPVYSNKLHVNNIRILSNLDNDAINGVSKAVIYINGDMYSIPRAMLGEVLAGNNGEYTSPPKIPSNTVLNYEIKFLDAFDNEIKVTNNKGKSRTSKKEPSVSLEQTTNTVTSTYFDIELKNVDEVNINNYRYVIYDSTNAVIVSHKLNDNEVKQNIELNNLDPNTTYVIKILGDYDIEDGNGINKNAVLGETKFTTKPLSSLGYVRVKSGTVDVTSDSAKLESYIDISAVSDQLMDLLNTFKMTITDDEGNLIYEREFNSNNIQEIKGGEKFTDEIVDLVSGTEYYVTFTATAKQGKVVEEIPVTCGFKSFTINKTPAQVNITNKFVTGSMIDFDVRIDDLEGTILSNRVILEIRDNTDKLVSTEYLDINSDYKRLTYTKLLENVDYKFTYKVEEYNEGYDNRTFQSDYTIFEEIINTTPGIRGNIELNSLLRQIESANLFNIEDLTRMRLQGNTGYKDYDMKNNVMTIGAKGGYVNYSYYVPEVASSSVEVSFYAKYAKDTPNKAPVYLSKGRGDTRSFLLDLTDEYKKYTYVFKTTSDYIGFVIVEKSGTNTRTNVDIKDLTIINTASDVTETDITKSYHKSGFKFTDTVMAAGDESMPTHDGSSTMVGNTGNGYAKITNLVTKAEKTFEYTGNYQSYSVTPGRYKIELWGAQGGSNFYNGGTEYFAGGKGAYTSGNITFTSNAELYFYVGGKGETSNKSLKKTAGGYNGGGSGDHDNQDNEVDGGGGGATDVRLESGAWNNLKSLQSRIMVAAGGGGGSDHTLGGPAGGITSKTVQHSTGASQYTGYAFGYGQDGVRVRSNSPVAGGGGGYFGGYAIDNGSNYYNPGAGGSSYISGHKGCVAYHLSSQASGDYITYKEKDMYMGELSIDLVDAREEITTNDFYLRIYSGGQLVENKQFEFDSDELVDYVTNYEFVKNKTYAIYLSVKIRDRFYDISSVTFDTSAEIRSIRNVTQFVNMHTNAKYIVLNDLDFTKSSSNFGSTFYGEIDFQGHKVKSNVVSRGNYILYSLGSGGLIENLVLDYTIDNTSPRSSFYGFAQYNYGTFDNLMINVNEGATQNGNYVFTMGFYVNYGKIRNFVINSAGAISARSATGILMWSNEGVVENGYVYGQNMNGNFESYDRDNKDMAPIAGQLTTNGVIRNVFSLISVNKDTNPDLTTEKAVGNIVGYAATGRVENSYSVEDPNVENSKFTSQDPNFGRGHANATVKNLYYVSETTYLGNKSSMMSKLALWDETLQKKILNTSNGWDVTNLVSLGYYPQVKMNDCMPRQELISLPKITDGDLVDVTSAEQIEVGGDYAKVEIHFNNPAGETITDIGIRDIGTVEILSQENMYGKSVVVAKLSSPISYKSKYYIRNIKITGVMGYTYEKNYTDLERPIDVDLYYPIKTLNDWKELVSKPTQNYMLMNDLDFKNETISNYIVGKTFTGKLNGNGHKLKNITITSTSYYGFFNCYIKGTIENLFVENYHKTGYTGYGGFFYRASSNAMFNNVHINTAKINATTYLGGLVSYSDNTTTIKNCSVSNLIGRTNPSANITGFRAGGLVGYINTGTILNSYAYNVDFEFNNLLTSSGVGGIAGQTSNGYIDDVYATGNIKANANYVGGIAGYGSAKISRAWSGVDISTELDYVGGVYGYRETTNNKNTLVTGDIYSSYAGDNIHRSFGNSVSTQMGYYAWDGQKVYGLVTEESQIEELLTLEELADKDTYIERIGLGEQFDYSDLSDGKMPKLKNIDTGKLLPNQSDYKLIVETINVDEITIEAQVDKAELNILIDNPNEYEITELMFDHLNITNIIASGTKNGKTTFRLNVTPEKFLDSYCLTGVKYKIADGVEKVASLYTRIEKTFYKQIHNVDEWLEIKDSTMAENYLLTTDLDFSPEANNGRVIQVPSGLRIARLESNSKTEKRALKNMSINLTAGGNGMIRVLTKTLYGIKFENISISMAKSTGGYYSGDSVGVIAYNYADIDDIEIKDLVVDAGSSSYVGFIANNYGQDTRYIKMNGTVTQDNDGNDIWGYRVRGVSYVGGFMGYSADRDTYHLEANSVNVYGSGTYVGGAIGHKPYNYTCNDYYYRMDNMFVTGKSNVGGMFGYGIANGNQDDDGSINYSYVINSKVHNIGGDYTGAAAGTARHYTTKWVYGRNNTVTSVGSYGVGGLFGWTYDVQYCYVYDTTVTNGNGSYTGGLTGASGYTTQYCGVEDTVVTSIGTGAGGMFGYKDSTAQYNYTKNVTINGKNSVGGFAGYVTTGRLYHNTVNANIIASGNNTGGLMGYLNNIDYETTSYSTLARHNVLVNTNITSTGDRVGFFSGYIPSDLYDDYHYNNVLVANMTITDTANYGILTGYDKEYITTPQPRIFIYENNKIIRKNGEAIISSEYVKDIDDFASTTYLDSDTKARMMPSASTLRTTNFWTGTAGLSSSYWNTSWTDADGNPQGVTDGYYPRNKQTISKNPIFELPTGDVTYNLRTMALGMAHELPEVSVYSSGVNTLNIEFDKIDDYTYFEVYENDKKIFEKDLLKKTYSITYNYKSDLKIVVMDGVNTRKYTYKAEDLVNKVTTFDNNYAYIYEDKLVGNVKEKDEKFIHLYDNKALTADLKIYDLEKESIISRNNTFSVSLLTDPIALHKAEYDGVLIDTFATYSIIHKENGDLLFESQIFVKDGVLEIVDGQLDNIKNSIIIDEYANDNYVSILGTDGIIYDLKESIKKPSNFANKNIKYMSNNLNTKSSIVVVMYDTGKVIVFDYRTGRKVEEKKATEDVSVVDYFKSNLTRKENLLESSKLMDSYKESLDVKKNLEKDPILTTVKGEYITQSNNDEKDKNNNSTVVQKFDKNYVTYYNATKDSYDVINVDEVLNSTKSEVVSENDKIYTSNEFVNLYMRKSILERVFGDTNAIVIFIIILLGIFGSLGLWFRSIKKLKES